MTSGANVDATESAIASQHQTTLGYSGARRVKAAVALGCLWGSVFVLHIVAWGHWLVYGLTALTGAHLLRLLVARPEAMPEPLPSTAALGVTTAIAPDPAHWPYVSILVAAKNEVSVIGGLVEALSQMDYPRDRYDFWIIDDASTDGTAELLDRLAHPAANLHVVHREPGAVGGKSGALNQVWRQTRGDLILVFDADARVSPDLLRRVVPFFQRSEVGAVQVRKAIANGSTNFWTHGQVAEMAFDAYCQIKRIARGGIGELRGNGQFVRRAALESCGGWNEETITDDLDLTFRLHLTGWTIAVTLFPAVQEEGVVRAVSLWHQRNRWAEGGYQRYLDYWRLLNPSRMGWARSIDLFFFWLMQYALPTMALPDLALAVARSRPPMLVPLSSVVMGFSMLGMMNALWKTQKTSPALLVLQTLRGMVYMTHWLLVVSTVTLRMAIRPKRLKWVKTQHVGLDKQG